mmetsp:Transcript_7357/g.9948  ORF Transcript_7357/g.9948 Transcript_7357/m.9948 type:complete len:363 (+) Transcript_7357:83-1171(+)|eukprot:CAMPEP_0196572432 /NCGR_PEP_ID=MMETSP1081-20130531/2489_1 /TAXON_ID=36882 /ORGANISM="Pyramimonas amylifera, Strain CCMP720" /LENGTH=362 /DNA_ID=CAMNT_0041889759 /DNA_START=71 /DNA_END=1159 /DNA_ORIENTATION=-
MSNVLSIRIYRSSNALSCSSSSRTQPDNWRLKFANQPPSLQISQNCSLRSSRHQGLESSQHHRKGQRRGRQNILVTHAGEEGVEGEETPMPVEAGGTRVIVVTSGKGGVGKTTTTSNIGVSIARLGYRVGLLDADIGLRNLDLLLGLENRVLYTGMEVLDGECRLEQALIRDKRWRNLALLCISKNRQRYNVTRSNMEELTNMMMELGFHYILVDCPAGIDIGFVNAIASAKEALVVTTPEITSIRDADRVAGLLEANGIYDVKLIVNRVRADMIAKNDMMSVKDVQEMLGIPLLGAIPEDTNVIISTNRGEPLVLRKKLTLSGIAFENAARRLVGKKDYLIDLTTPYKSLMQRMKEFVVGE